jgi:hypothetical protein
MSGKTIPPLEHGEQAGRRSATELHPAWQAFIQYCRELDHGEIERVKIQNGLPVSAEVTRKKIRWC